MLEPMPSDFGVVGGVHPELVDSQSQHTVLDGFKNLFWVLFSWLFWMHLLSWHILGN